MKPKTIAIKLILSFYFLFFIHIFSFAEEEEIGKIENVIGEAEIISGEDKFTVTKDLPIHPSDIITTKENAIVKVYFFDGANIILYEKSELKIKEYKVSIDSDKKSLKSVFDNIKGKIRFFVKPDKNTDNDVKYRTSNAIMGIRGTGGYIVANEIAKTQLVVTSGAVDFSNPAAPELITQIKENEWGQMEGNNPPSPPQPVTPELLESLDIGLPTGFELIPSGEEKKKEEPKPKTPPLPAPKNDDEEESEYFRLGPVASFGFFQFFSVGLEARLFRFIGLGANIGGIPKTDLKQFPSLKDKLNTTSNDTPISNITANIFHAEVRAVIYPFLGSFFIGSALGIRRVDSTTDACQILSSINCVPLQAHLKVNTTYVTPQFGWLGVWKSGFTLGTELGVQIPLTAGSQEFDSQILTNNSSYYNQIINSYAYNNFQKTIRDDIGDYLTRKPLPFWNILKIGWLF